MNPVEQLNLTIWSWIESVKSMRRGTNFVPLLLYFGVQLLLFAALWNFAHPAISWIFAPLLEGSFGEPALHYPNDRIVFPAVFARIDLVLGLGLGALLFGAATWLFAETFRGGRTSLGEGLRRAARRYPALFVAQLPGTLLAAAVLFLAERQIGLSADMAGHTIRLLRYGSLFLAIVAQALFAFAMVLVVLEGTPLKAALGRSVRLAGRNAIGTFMLVAVPVLMHYPAALLVRRGSLLMERGAPEIMPLITGADMAVGLVANYLILAGITRFYLAGRATA